MPCCCTSVRILTQRINAVTRMDYAPDVDALLIGLPDKSIDPALNSFYNELRGALKLVSSGLS